MGPFAALPDLWITRRGGLLYTHLPGAAGALSSILLDDETDVSAQRTQAEAEARLPRTHGHPRRQGDPQAPPRAGAEASFRLTPRAAPTPVQRRHRLSRSRDFDAVYRQGKSVSTRYLVLYWFDREDDDDGPHRVGIAVPKKLGTAVARNRVKRRLREVWKSLADEIQPGRDVVLVARPGLAEAAEAHDLEWLRQRVREALGKASA
jgi:ribonuclease P protein component